MAKESLGLFVKYGILTRFIFLDRFLSHSLTVLHLSGGHGEIGPLLWCLYDFGLREGGGSGVQSAAPTRLFLSQLLPWQSLAASISTYWVGMPISEVTILST